MPEMNDIVKLAVDSYHGKVENYSVDQAQEVLRQALVEANGGSTKLNYKNIRDGKCAGLFAIIEEIISRTVIEGLQGDEFFNALVDFRNVAIGDQNAFLVEDSELFYVAEAADGTQGIRRQRIGGTSEITIKTTLKVVRIYEELNRVLSGRVDFNHFIGVVAESFRQALLNDVYALWTTATADDFGGITYFPDAGSYDEDELLDLIAHVEAAAGGKTATLVGTKKALRNLAPSIMAESAKNELHDLGYYGKFYGSPCIAVPQRHKFGSDEFIMDDDIITIIAGDDMPIKCVTEGESLVIFGDPLQNADLTQEYFVAQKWGMGIVLAGGNSGVGRYEME